MPHLRQHGRNPWRAAERRT